MKSAAWLDAIDKVTDLEASDKLKKAVSYHVDEESVDFKVGVLLGVADDA